MSHKKYTVISDFVTEVGRVPLTEMNILVSSRKLGDLLIWEELLERRGLDYCICYTSEEYHLVTDMVLYQKPATRRVWELDTVADLFSDVSV